MCDQYKKFLYNYILNKKTIPLKRKQRIANKIIKLSNKLKIGSADFIRFDCFEYLESKGVHLTPTHFYQPIPILSKINWKKHNHPKPMIGIDFNPKSQLELLNQFQKFKKNIIKFLQKILVLNTSFISTTRLLIIWML